MREDRMMNEKKQSAVKRILGTRGMGAVITAFAGLIIIYVAFGLIDRKVFAGQNVMNLSSIHVKISSDRRRTELSSDHRKYRSFHRLHGRNERHDLGNPDGDGREPRSWLSQLQ